MLAATQTKLEAIKQAQARDKGKGKGHGKVDPRLQRDLAAGHSPRLAKWRAQKRIRAEKHRFTLREQRADLVCGVLQERVLAPECSAGDRARG